MPFIWIHLSFSFEHQEQRNSDWPLQFNGTVKLGIKELLNKEQIGNSEPFPVTNLPVYLINSEQIGISEQLWDDQKVP